MPRIDFTKVGWCLSCKRNEHDLCDLHINDGAVDALDFIEVYCDCPCGRLGPWLMEEFEAEDFYKNIQDYPPTEECECALCEAGI